MTSIHYKQENSLPCNDVIEDCGYVPTKPFNPDYVKQVVQNTEKLFNDICDRVKLDPVSERQFVQKAKQNIRSVSKEKLIEWLENVCYFLDTCSIPLLQKTCEIEKLQGTVKSQREKIEDQKSIIELQKKLFGKSDNGLNSVQTVVQNTAHEEMKSVQNSLQTDMKTYSSFFSQTLVQQHCLRRRFELQ
jgi:hypothetical protein